MKVSVDEDLINVVTKSTLLNLCGVLSSCVLIGYFIYLMETGGMDPMMTIGFRCLDGLMNTFCIFLVFAFAAPYYDIGCKCCHFAMRNCCKKVATTVVMIQNKNENV